MVNTWSSLFWFIQSKTKKFAHPAVDYRMFGANGHQLEISER